MREHVAAGDRRQARGATFVDRHDAVLRHMLWKGGARGAVGPEQALDVERDRGSERSAAVRRCFRSTPRIRFSRLRSDSIRKANSLLDPRTEAFVAFEV